ncbi:MAG TPA: glycoside hydrolase domain-containing protein, partial [Kribbella sp.]
QEKVREVLSRLYTGSEIGQGYPGDEDNGEMSSWYLFSSLGFYPLQVGSPSYAIGSPLFTKATIRLAGGKKLVVSAPGNSSKNIYVKSVRVNGKQWTSTSLPHDLIANGGKIEFEMTDQPTKWGTGRNDAPPSITKPGEDPMTWRDSTSDTGAVIGAGGTDVSTLIDNDAKTQVTLTGDRPTVTVALPQGRPVGMYTLTSGATGTAPSAWTLEGSNDGTTWTTVDRRTNESWAWASYTRSFSVASPKAYTQYRLVFAPATDGVTLAEIELLGTLKGVEPGTHPSDKRVAETKPSPTPSQSIDRNWG